MPHRCPATAAGVLALPLLLVLVFPRAAGATAVDIWAFDLDYAPAPPPQDGPPLSFYASRDPSLLRWQILGIVGGYVFFVLALFSALFTVGKRWRRAACQSRSSLSMEMVNSNRWTSDTPQHSSVKDGRAWGMLSRQKSSTSTLTSKSPIVTTKASFDPAVLEADKQKREDELAQIYAQVLSGDTRSPKEVAATKSPEFAFGPGGETVSMHSRTYSNATSTRSFSHRVPPQLRTDVNGQPLSPASPRSYRSYEYAHSPQSPQASTPGRWPQPPQPVHEDPHEHALQHQRAPSGASVKSKRARSVRSLTISAPMPSSRYPEEDSKTPLSPHNYNPGPPPLPPPPETPATPILDDADTDDSDIIETYGMEGMDRPRGPMPMSAPHRPYISVAPRGWQGQGQGHDGLPDPQSAASSTKALPLRSYASNSTFGAGASRPDLANPLASPTKVTLLSPRKDRFVPGSARHHPLTAGLPTPYSPYMPQTPMTPVTPHLINRAERRQRQREAGRRVATQDDVVKDDDEVWGAM